jgi:hypothetical protein
LLGTARPASAQTKLYLKDGTYQLVKSYEVRGDRVRYYSLERSDWEEVPVALVDFDAIKRAAQQEQIEQKKQLEEAKELQRERFEKPMEEGLEVAPGVHLPMDWGVYAYDGTRVIRLLQSPGEIVTDKKRVALNLVLPAPILKGRQLVVLPGAKAPVRVRSTKPIFYVQFGDDGGERVKLLAVKSDKERRVVEKVDTRQLPGAKPSEVREGVPLERVKLAPGLYKITPMQALEPGEYALGELIRENLDLDVWDFGIDGSPAVLSVPPSTGPASMSEKPPVNTQPALPKGQPPLDQQLPHDPNPPSTAGPGSAT